MIRILLIETLYKFGTIKCCVQVILGIKVMHVEFEAILSARRHPNEQFAFKCECKVNLQFDLSLGFPI